MDLKSAAKEKLDSIRERIVALSHTIHANPEPGFGEVRASKWIAEFLSGEGFRVERFPAFFPENFFVHL